MKWHPTRKTWCACESDVTKITTPRRMRRGRKTTNGIFWSVREARMIGHYRERDNAHFWHWDDSSKLLKEDTE